MLLWRAYNLCRIDKAVREQVAILDRRVRMCAKGCAAVRWSQRCTQRVALDTGWRIRFETDEQCAVRRATPKPSFDLIARPAVAVMQIGWSGHELEDTLQSYLRCIRPTYSYMLTATPQSAESDDPMNWDLS
jgi:hypothetical protein